MAKSQKTKKSAGRKKRFSFLSFVPFLLILLSLPLVVTNLSEQRDVRQRAASTPTKVPPTPSRIPTMVLLPTPEVIQGHTNLQMTVFLHGIGNGGDNSNPRGTGNILPVHPQRNMYLEVYNARDQLVMKQVGMMTYDPNAGNFKGNIDLGPGFQTGNYILKFKTDQYLQKQVGSVQEINGDRNHTIPPITLTAGDTNNDNKINILDYNTLMRCYNYPLSIRNCTLAMKDVADITDDSRVDGTDYNLFLREVWVQPGQ